jgi:hypothetical protein
MPTRITTTATALAAAGLLALTGCGPETSDSGGTTNDKPSGAAAPATPGSADAAADAAAANLPDMTGKGLQSAQDQAQAAGFYHLTSHDALGRGRNQLLDRNWKVCFQTPRAGEHPTDTKVDFATVKLEETCPGKDEGAMEEAGATMPDFKGKSVRVAREALDSGTSITVEDASGEGRVILVESNWQVCTQDPAPGAALDGRPVSFTAVKFGETC